MTGPFMAIFGGVYTILKGKFTLAAHIYCLKRIHRYLLKIIFSFRNKVIQDNDYL
jgi:hypothetical protein